ncbi:hypothetical protein BDA99DRAFT_564985 [Phascolomyces articulosus]|uniref:Uncharacterized protein n=1 Tax=Phascolomyces articulosus TaxID=60185 RepID=A0AAD5P8Y7_9FUNG|nr:hypothetical protein BDA99DRAFT_564985 [Phascolomyces articulosus]
MLDTTAITGFLRPSNIERIDASRTAISNTHLRLIIAKPKEKRRGQPIEKSVSIHVHTNHLLCPLRAYVTYQDRFCQEPCPRAYPVSNGPRTQVFCFIRHVHNHSQPVSSERISNHIKYMIDFIPHPEGVARPKARALGSTAAIEAGASLDDVLVHGSWFSSSVFDTFYRLSRETVTDFTSLALPLGSTD